MPNAGFTSIREPGGFGIRLARVVGEGLLPGPMIYSAGAILSPTGGHAAFTRSGSASSRTRWRTVCP
jgi:imidazolonepropionase-like amidohydrolase